MIIKLREPIVLSEGATPITELTITRTKLCAGDLRGLPGSSLAQPTVDDLLMLSGRLTGQGGAVLNQLCLADMDELFDVVVGFLVTGRATGKT